MAKPGGNSPPGIALYKIKINKICKNKFLR